MRRTVTRAALVGVLASSLLGVAAVPASAAAWVYKGRFPTYGNCSSEGSAIVRGPVYSEYKCDLVFVNQVGGYNLYVR